MKKLIIKKGQCIGLFEVYSGLIKSISLYTKK